MGEERVLIEDLGAQTQPVVVRRGHDEQPLDLHQSIGEGPDVDRAEPAAASQWIAPPGTSPSSIVDI